MSFHSSQFLRPLSSDLIQAVWHWCQYEIAWVKTSEELGKYYTPPLGWQEALTYGYGIYLQIIKRRVSFLVATNLLYFFNSDIFTRKQVLFSPTVFHSLWLKFFGARPTKEMFATECYYTGQK